MNIDGLNFARTCNDHDTRMPKGRGDCFDYGQWYGCNSECPVFCNGNCKLEDMEGMVEQLRSEGIIDFNEYIEMYPEMEKYIKKETP